METTKVYKFYSLVFLLWVEYEYLMMTEKKRKLIIIFYYFTTGHCNMDDEGTAKRDGTATEVSYGALTVYSKAS